MAVRKTDGKSLIVDSWGNPFDLNLPGGAQGRGSAIRGGVFNRQSGMGGAGDKARGTFFHPTIVNNRWFLSNIYAESWAAAKFINIVVDDMFLRPKRYLGDDESDIEAIEEIRQSVMADTRIEQAMKAARLYGTSFMVLVFGIGMDSHAALDTERISPDYPLRAIHVVDRFCVDAEEESRITDVTNPLFGEAEIYHIYPKDLGGQQVRWRVHRSRMIRFDGRKALSMFGWSGFYEREWGLSELQNALDEILHDSSSAQGISHLVQEASISVFSVAGMRNAVTGDVADDDVSPEKYGEMINRAKSIYKSIFLDSTDSYDRTQVNFTGIGEVLNLFAGRLAAMADIPITRFLGRSPTGLSSTGEHDMENYAIHVAARQARYQRDSGDHLDMILARAAGLEEAPEYEWPSLIDLRETDRMTTVRTAVEAIHTAYNDGAFDENYYAELLSQYDDVFGSVPEPPEMDELPEIDPNAMPPGNEGNDDGETE